MIMYVEQSIVSGLSHQLEQMEREFDKPNTLPTRIVGPPITKLWDLNLAQPTKWPDIINNL